MLVIEQFHENPDTQSDYVRCPACKKGRLCDKPAGDKAAVAIKVTVPVKKNSRIILKCPKCSQKFLIYLSKDEKIN
ncbi:MAG: hypothetical protein J1E35_07105 [Lachnospiraceae bacterium]|nr:hypothetical protein [Lachnospiraceae bacterium]